MSDIIPERELKFQVDESVKGHKFELMMLVIFYGEVTAYKVYTSNVVCVIKDCFNVFFIT